MAQLSNAEARELNERVVPLLVGVYERARAEFTEQGWKLVERSLRKPTLASSEGAERLFEPAMLLGFTTRTDLLWELFEAGREIPFWGNYTAWEPIRALDSVAYRKLSLSEDSRQGEVEQYLSFADHGGNSGPPVVDVPMRGRLEGDLIARFRQELASPLPLRLYSYYIAKTRELSVMWAFGGSSEWPRSRVEGELDACGQIAGAYLAQPPNAGM